ncbi:hypothetical protein AWV79_08630 [Cupriavidus sp. UYMMa02A]|nr:hypothetical protein AWV79_08630 [Cupriavidus sp. UYMMa02A]
MFLSVALLAASAITAFAGERPRDTGIACARAANAYCNVPDEGNRREPPGVSARSDRGIAQLADKPPQWRRQR